MKNIIIYEEDKSLLPLYDLLSMCLHLKGYQAKRVYQLTDCGRKDTEWAEALILNLETQNACIPLLAELDALNINIPKQSTLVLGVELTDEEILAIHHAGCSFLDKPFKFSEISDWLNTMDVAHQQLLAR